MTRLEDIAALELFSTLASFIGTVVRILKLQMISQQVCNGTRFPMQIVIRPPERCPTRLTYRIDINVPSI